MQSLTKTTQTFINSILNQVADHLSKQEGLFAKKQTKASLLKLMKAASEEKTTKVVAKKEKKDKEEDGVMPEGWDDMKKWTKFVSKMDSLEDGQYLNVVSKLEKKTDKKGEMKGFVMNEVYHLCAKEGEEDALEAVVTFLDRMAGKDSDEEEKEDDEEADDEEEKEEDDDEEADDEEEEDDDFVSGYDADQVKKLKSAIKKSKDDKYVNLTTLHGISKTTANEKKYVFDDKRKIAYLKLADEDEMKAYVRRVKKMLE